MIPDWDYFIKKAEFTLLFLCPGIALLTQACGETGPGIY